MSEILMWNYSIND